MDRNKRSGFKFRNRRYNSGLRRSIIAPFFTALAAAAVKDLTSGDSRILGYFRKLFSLPEPTGKDKKQILEAEFNVLDEDRAETIEEKE